MLKKTLAAIAMATMALPVHAITATVTGFASPNPLTLVVAGLLTLLLTRRFSD